MLVRKKSGFTLIELLVVIAIIAILAAILFPVFAKAREAARKATCQSNMKQCAQSLKMYTDDYDGMLPSSVLNGGVNPPVAQQTSDFLTKLTTTNATAFPPTNSNRYTWPQVLYENMRNRDVMFCPSDSTDRNPLPTTFPMVSYWMKLAIDVAWTNTTISRRKMSDYGYESDQIAFFEYKGWHFGDQNGIHRNLQMNVSYMDSHVETITLPNNGTCPTETAPICPTGTPPVLATAMAGGASQYYFEPFYYNTNVNTAGVATVAGTPGAPTSLSPGVTTFDPTSNYDTF